MLSRVFLNILEHCKRGAVRYGGHFYFSHPATPTLVQAVQDFERLGGSGLMGEWKVNLNLRIDVQCKARLQEIADREKRSLGNLGYLLMEWATDQLVGFGSTEKLLRRKAPVPRNPNGNYRRGRCLIAAERKI